MRTLYNITKYYSYIGILVGFYRHGFYSFWRINNSFWTRYKSHNFYVLTVYCTEILTADIFSKSGRTRSRGVGGGVVDAYVRTGEISSNYIVVNQAHITLVRHKTYTCLSRIFFQTMDAYL